MMHYYEFHSNFITEYHKNPQGQRMGQFFMNSLHKIRPDLYHAIPADLDCFYQDKFFNQCSSWVAQRW